MRLVNKVLCPSWCFESMKLLAFIQSAWLVSVLCRTSYQWQRALLVYSFLEVKISGATWIFPDGRFEKMKSIAIGEGTNATEREENLVSWNLFHLSLSYLNAAKIKSDVNLVVVNSTTGRESSQPERRRRRVGSIQGRSYTLC